MLVGNISIPEGWQPSRFISCMHDGRIPAELMAAAIEADRAWYAALPPASPAPAKPRKVKTARELARLLIDRTSATGCCTDQDIEAAGFTQAEILHHMPAARAIARSHQLEA